MPKAYRLKADASFPRPLRHRELLDGNIFWEVEGVSYEAGDVITEDKMTPRDKERAENGELDHLLEAVEENAIPKPEPAKAEHEAEREILESAGKEVAGEEKGLEPFEAPKPAKKPRKRTSSTAQKNNSTTKVSNKKQQAPTTKEVTK